MEVTTFQDQRVKNRLADFIVVKFQSENPGQPPHKELMDYYGVMGLPTYLILQPKNAK
jgi:thiol:disulfide interchange protein